MDKETRDAVITTIINYAAHHDDSSLLDIVGWTPTRRNVADAEVAALLAAVLPLQDDARLNTIVLHIAECLLYQSTDESEEVAA